jgi:hypothetical protein
LTAEDQGLLIPRSQDHQCDPILSTIRWRLRRRLGFSWVIEAGERRSLAASLEDVHAAPVDERVFFVLDEPTWGTVSRLYEALAAGAHRPVLPLLSIEVTCLPCRPRTEFAVMLDRDQVASLNQSARSDRPREFVVRPYSAWGGLGRTPTEVRILGTEECIEHEKLPPAPITTVLTVVEAAGDDTAASKRITAAGLAERWHLLAQYGGFLPVGEGTDGRHAREPFVAVESRSSGRGSHGVWVDSPADFIRSVAADLTTGRPLREDVVVTRSYASAASPPLLHTIAAVRKGTEFESDSDQLRTDATVRSAVGVQSGERINVVPLLPGQRTKRNGSKLVKRRMWWTHRSSRWIARSVWPVRTTLVRVYPAPLAITEQNACFADPWVLDVLGVESGEDVLLVGAVLRTAPVSSMGADGAWVEREDRRAEDVTSAERRERRVKAFAVPDGFAERQRSTRVGYGSPDAAAEQALGLAPSAELGRIWLDPEIADQLGAGEIRRANSWGDDAEPLHLSTLRVIPSRQFLAVKHAREMAFAWAIALSAIAIGLFQLSDGPEGNGWYAFAAGAVLLAALLGSVWAWGHRLRTILR